MKKIAFFFLHLSTIKTHVTLLHIILVITRQSVAASFPGQAEISLSGHQQMSAEIYPMTPAPH